MMKNQKQTAPQSRAASARVIDGKLILSFPDALSPVVWQMNLNEVAASALRVEEKAKTKNFALVMTTQDSAMDVALFAAREQAVEALMTASHALENAAGQIQASTPAGYYAGPHAMPAANIVAIQKPRRRWIPVGLALLALLGFFTYWTSLQPRAPQSYNADPAANTAASTQGGSAQQQSGVPVSADEFLEQQ